MFKKKFDIAIIGNGIIGTMLAFKLINSKKKICIIGPSERKGGASVASGAMLNVFGEIDYGIKNDDYINKKINIGIIAKKKWMQLKKKLDKSIFTADDTIIYKSKNATYLEKICFNNIKYYGKKNNCIFLNHKKLISFKKNKNLKISDCFLIKGEGAIDSKKIFKFFDRKISKSKNIHAFNDEVEKINNDNIKLKFSKKILIAKQIIICAGSFSKNIKTNFRNKIIDLYFGIGSAYEIFDKNKILEKQMPKRTVIRSPNKGSTCGIHILPRANNQYYLGAGSYISHVPNYNFRLGTLAYLFNTAQNELFGKMTKLECKPILGFRPFSFDGQPIIGEIQKNIFIATGTKRDGLTLSPVITDDIINWIYKKKLKYIYPEWRPDRNPISFYNQKYSAKVYTDNKIAGLLEHKDIKKKDIKFVSRQLKKESKIFHKKIIKIKKLKNNFAVHPELLNTF